MPEELVWVPRGQARVVNPSVGAREHAWVVSLSMLVLRPKVGIRTPHCIHSYFIHAYAGACLFNYIHDASSNMITCSYPRAYSINTHEAVILSLLNSVFVFCTFRLITYVLCTS